MALVGTPDDGLLEKLLSEEVKERERIQDLFLKSLLVSTTLCVETLVLPVLPPTPSPKQNFVFFFCVCGD